MRPESMRQARAATPRRYPSVEEIEWHMRNGRRLRAEAIAATFGGLFRRLGREAVRPFASRAVPTPDPRGQGGVADAAFAEAATPLRSPLMAIRSSAEILRDNPDLTPAQRARFVEILLAEEQRLERMIALAFGGGGTLQGR